MGHLEDVTKTVIKIQNEVTKVGSPGEGPSFVMVPEVVGVSASAGREFFFGAVPDEVSAAFLSFGFTATNTRDQPVAVSEGAATSFVPETVGIWSADYGAASIYEQDTADGSQLNAVGTPAGATNPTGVGVDGSESIWFCDSDAASIYKIDQNASIVTEFASPSSNPYGLEYDGNGYLYVAESHFAKGTDYSSIYKIDAGNGNNVASFTGAGRGTTGVGMDASRSFWVGNQRQASLYKLDSTGSAITSITSPSSEPRGVGVGGSGSIWNADPGAASIWEIQTDGTEVQSFASPSSNPFGLGNDDAPLL